MDPIIRRQQQQRSNSISGQEFHSNGNYQRLKHSLYSHHHSPYDDQRGLQVYYGAQSGLAPGRPIQHPTSGSYQQHFVGRSISPNERMSQFDPPQRDGSIKISMENRHHLPRNNLHASLECLNLTYADHEQQQQQPLPLQHHQQFLRQQPHYNQQPHHLLTNQHYAASYVLSTPPPNTIINQSGDQDLAAAAMGNCPPSQQPYQHSSVTNNLQQQQQHYHHHHQQQQPQQSNYSSQSLLNRTIAHVSQQSPLRRLGLGSASGSSNTTTSANVLSQLNGGGHHTPIRAGHSSLSLASSSHPIEDKLQSEIKKLQSELKTEKEKNEALNSQLNINSGLMAAFEQSLTTLNTRLRQLSALSEQKDKDLEKLREQMKSTTNKEIDLSEKSTSPMCEFDKINTNQERGPSPLLVCNELDKQSEQNLIKIIEDLRRQLIEKDRLLTDTRLEALSAAHQLEQLESRLNGEHSLLANDNDIDEGVMMANHSPSDSDAITDSAHFSEMNSQISKSNRHQASHDIQANNHNDMILFGQTNSDICNGQMSCNSNDGANSNKSTMSSTDDASEQTNQNNYHNHHHHQQHPRDDQSNNSSDFLAEDGRGSMQQYQHSDFGQAFRDHQLNESANLNLENGRGDADAMNKLMDNLLVSN